MTTRIASPSDRFIGYSTRQEQHQQPGDVFLGENTRPGLLSATTQSIALPPNANYRTAHNQTSSTTTTMATSSSPVFVPMMPRIPTTPPRRRRTSRRDWEARPIFWDTNDGESPGDVQAPAANEANEVDDPYLTALVDNEFSSPSSYPSFTNPPAANQSVSSRFQRPPQASAPGPGSDSAPFPRSTAPRNNASAGTVTGAFGTCNLHHLDLNLDFSAPERSETQNTTSTSTAALESQNTLFTDTGEWDELFDTPASSFDENMPVTRSGRRLEAATPPLDSVHRRKRLRTSANAPTPNLRKSASSKTRATEIRDSDDDDCFVDKKPLQSPLGKEEPGSEDLTTIDLTEANEVPEELRKPEKDNRTKISAFQCVICMDDATTLTVTHCGKFEQTRFTVHLLGFTANVNKGHLYCAQCLHSSLHVDATRGKCPMCRQKLDMKPRELYNTKTKGYWRLELKLMTATKKGKRKVNEAS